MIDQHFLPLAIAVVHRLDLRQRHVRFIDDEQKILREIVDQRVRLVARLAAIQMPAVVLDARCSSPLPASFPDRISS